MDEFFMSFFWEGRGLQVFSKRSLWPLLTFQFFYFFVGFFSPSLFSEEVSLRNLINEEGSALTPPDKEESTPDDSSQESTKICWYWDGATVHNSLPNSAVQKGNEFCIPNLSQFIHKKSIIPKGPDAVFIQNFQLQSENFFVKNATPGEEKKGEATRPKKEKRGNKTPVAGTLNEEDSPNSLVLNLRDADKVTEKDMWKIQYSLSHVNWMAQHIIEFTKDRAHINFYTIFHVNNQSKVHFKNAHIQFFEGNLPGNEPEEDATDAVREQAVPVYSYDTVSDFAPLQSKMIVWSSAKRIAITMNNGLFVGGPFLKKLKGTAFPRIESRINFLNIKEVGLGKPLPAGKVAVYHNRNDFISLAGYTKMFQVKGGEEITLRMPASLMQSTNTEAEEADAGLLYAKLEQSSYRVLTPAMSEAEYQLEVTNSQKTTASVTVTVNQDQQLKCSIIRSSLNAEVNKRGETFWKLEIPPNSSRTIRYKLTIRTLI
ncbi:hypothetical protein AGMMS49949_02840 [Alphaproteobacteria bacterium]|nr:hypothetical protein AGMMS49949_02840 [Alphaproteobacteria bacterium]GHS97330.1 hypothetical protein AGMMS50296_4230 [Alphaproteobacteria bacterium]